MKTLVLPPGFRFPTLCTALAEGDTMHDGRDGHYLSVGLSALDCIEAALGGRTPRTILDLPCGFGRVTRMLRARFPSAEITVCDLDRPGVDFAAREFGARPVYSVPDLADPAADLALGRTFDLVWVGSLVTHLSEVDTLAFLRRMAAVLAPDGVLVVTSHGPTIAERLKGWGYGLEPWAVARVLDGYGARGFGHAGYDGGPGYGISLSDRTWWQNAAGDLGLGLVAYRVQAWDGHQDVVVLDGRPGVRPVERTDAPADVPDRAAVAAYDSEWARFDPGFYMATNPDVAAAVTAGTFATAFEHFRDYGRAEGRLSAACEATPASPC